MAIRDTIHSVEQNLHTVIITAREEDGSSETREAEPYSGGFQESCRLKLKIMPPCPSPFQCFVCPG